MDGNRRASAPTAASSCIPPITKVGRAFLELVSLGTREHHTLAAGGDLRFPAWSPVLPAPGG